MTRLGTTTGRYALGVAAVAVLLAGCGGGGDDGITIGAPATATGATTTPAPATTAPAGGSSGPEQSTTPPEESTPSTDRCHTSQVAVTFGPEDAGAGNRNATVVLTNTGGRTCTVFGYGGLQPLDAAGKPITTLTLTRVNPPAPALLRVPPGGKVYKGIHWTVIPSTGEECSSPVSAQVTPPDETDHITLKWPFGTVCGTIDGRPYTKTAP